MNKIRLDHLLKEHHKDAFMWASQCCNYNREDGKEVLQIESINVIKSETATQLYGAEGKNGVIIIKMKN